MSDFNAGTMFQFNTLSVAKSFRDRCTTIMMIVAAHDGYVWVMSRRDASRLRKIGYEVLC